MTGSETECPQLRVALFGAEAEALIPHLARYANLELVEKAPDVVVSFGGDGTLLAAELRWPGCPKVPILNSRLGHRCIPHPAADVIEALALRAKLSPSGRPRRVYWAALIRRDSWG